MRAEAIAITTMVKKSHATAVAAWIPLLVAPAIVISVFPRELPKWAYMWTLAFTIYCGCKWLTWRTYKSERNNTTTVARQFAYMLLWPGLDADAFLNETKVDDQPTRLELLSAVIKTSVAIACLIWVMPRTAELPVYLRGWFAAVCIVFMLHFGLFHLLSIAWRFKGVQARKLMNAPLLSTSLTEFWGKRWNVAFRDLTHKFLFRPLLRKLGANGALIVGFIMSGLIHDLVISVPAGGGYGEPTLYFMIQAIGVSIQKSEFASALKLDRGFRGWVVTTAFLLGPVVLLFHKPFMAEIMVPFTDLIGG